MKYRELYALNKDFVNTATSYAQTIISEYFLHVKDKSIVARSMGGVAGGQVRFCAVLCGEHHITPFAELRANNSNDDSQIDRHSPPTLTAA